MVAQFSRTDMVGRPAELQRRSGVRLLPVRQEESTMQKRATRPLFRPTILALILTALAMQTPEALSPDIVISQVYGGGGNSGAVYTQDFVELFNRGTTTVSLTGMSIQYASATGTGNFGGNPVTVLSGSLAPGQYYLVSQATGGTNGIALPTPDATGTVSMSATGGKVALVTSTTGLACNGGSTACSAAQLALIKDLVGWDGANFYETTPAPITANATAAIRLENGCAETDNNASDFATGTPTPRNTASPLNPCAAADAAPSVTSTFPVDGATDFPIHANLTVTFSEPVNVSSSWFTLVCSVSGTVNTAVGGGPTSFTLDPAVPLVHGETCTLTVVATQVSDQDANDPPDNMAADLAVSFSPLDVCATPYTPIYAIQGSGPSAAMTGNVTTAGVVVGDFEGSAGQSGFYLQDVTGDGDPATSDGIFVYTGSSSLVSVGQVVRVTGYARERFNQTTLNGSNSNTSAVPAANIVQCGTGSVPATDVTLPFANANDPERFEGMLVRLPQSLVISEYFNFDRFGEIVLALPLDGEPRPFSGTAVDEPGAAANARTLANALRRITLDDAQSAQNPATLRHPNGLPFSLANLFRGGDLVSNAVGVLGFDFSLYRIFPTGPADYVKANPRPAAPEPVGGPVRVAAMNTLNFFVTADYPSGDPLDNECGPLNNVECRGWDSDQGGEYARQRDKLLAALLGLDADIVGLTELENTTGVEPLAELVSGLPGYAYIDTGTIGTDAIKVGLLYRPSVVSPVGAYQILDSSDDPRFIDDKNRPSLAQTFQTNATSERFTVVVNHFKSRGSDCLDVGDPDTGDGQGNCSGTRTLAAQALVDWLATDPTGSLDPDFLVLGDLNSYAKEDPIDAIRAGADDVAGSGDDFANLIDHFQGAFAYSYVFDGQAGYLDHALASDSLRAQTTGGAYWHINADEPDVLDYDTSFKPPAQDALYEPNAYRSSDHDAVVVGLDLRSDATALEITGTFYDDNGAPTPLGAKFTAGGLCDVAYRTVEFYVDLNADGSFAADELVGTGTTNAAGIAEYSWGGSSSPPWTPGIWDVKAVFAGTGNCLASEGVATIAVVTPGDTANGGGWYRHKTTGSPRVNAGFTVRKQRDGSYRGQLLWHNNGKWRIKGALTSFGRTAPCTYGSATGVKCGASQGYGQLYSWNGATLAWDYVQDVDYVISFVDGGSSKKSGVKPDYFGISVTNFSDPSLPESAPEQLMGGNVTVP
jgi:hypothetical protein